jgi:translation initiation factor IF-2
LAFDEKGDGMKVFELAKELDFKALELIDKVRTLNLKIKNHMSDLSDDEVVKIREFLDSEKKVVEEAPKKRVRKTESSSVKRRPVVITRTKEITENAESTAAVSDGAAETKQEVETQIPVLETSTEQTSAEIEAPASETPSEEVAATPTTTTVAPTAAPVQAATPQTPAPVQRVVETRIEQKKENATPSRYSVIRVASKAAHEERLARPLIVKEAPEIEEKPVSSRKSADGKTEAGQWTADGIIREIQREEIQKKKTSTPKDEEINLFKSTDYLRRERVYQPKKKKVAIGRGSQKISTVEMSSKKKFVTFNESMSVVELADQLRVKVIDVLRKLATLGVEKPDDIEGPQEWFLDLDTIQIVAGEFQYEVKDATVSEEKIIQSAQNASPDEDANLKARGPVVTIMGHVDHGKTSILDLIRKSRVVAGEAGGITQHIGAYMIDYEQALANLKALQNTKEDAKKAKKDKAKEAPKKSSTAKHSDTITFLDTPGHAAFSAMRSRGAKVTDIVILVVSATEGVMPQTREALDHAKASGVPIIVAVNKMDLPDANFDRSLQQLSELGLVPEAWGGDTMFIPVSGLTGLGMDKLLEAIQLQAEVLELKANFEVVAEGSIVEAHLDKGRGPMATALIQNGVLKQGDFVVAGKCFGRVRALIDDQGRQIKEAGPSTPVAVLGLDSVPEAGDQLNAVSNERAAKDLIELRSTKEKEEKEKSSRKMSLEDLYLRMNEGSIIELPLVIKADVKGSAEAIQGALLRLPSDKIRIKVVASSVGGITESDVLLASASGAIVLGFNVRPDSKSKNEAERRGVEVKTYDIIYNLIDDVRKAMEGLLTPETKEVELGKAEVRNVFNLSKSGTVAGCFVIEGKIPRTALVRLLRDSRVVYTGKLSGLRRFKDEAKEVAKGYECGMSLENYMDIKVGDIIEAYKHENVAVTLESASPNKGNQPQA